MTYKYPGSVETGILLFVANVIVLIVTSAWKFVKDPLEIVIIGREASTYELVPAGSQAKIAHFQLVSLACTIVFFFQLISNAEDMGDCVSEKKYLFFFRFVFLCAVSFLHTSFVLLAGVHVLTEILQQTVTIFLIHSITMYFIVFPKRKLEYAFTNILCRGFRVHYLDFFVVVLWVVQLLHMVWVSSIYGQALATTWVYSLALLVQYFGHHFAEWMNAPDEGDDEENTPLLDPEVYHEGVYCWAVVKWMTVAHIVLVIML